VRILLAAPCLPYPGVRHAGGKLLLYLVERLSERHEIEMVVRRQPGEEDQVEWLAGRVASVHVAAVAPTLREGSRRSLLQTVLSIRKVAQAAGRLARSRPFDLAQIEFTDVGVFWNGPRRLASVLTCIDVLAKPAARRLDAARGVSRLPAWLAHQAQVAAEGRALRRVHGVLTLSEDDRSWLERQYPGIRADVLRYPGGLGFAGLPRAEVPGRVVYCGTLHRNANSDALLEFTRGTWPLVRRAVPDAEFVVVGAGAPPAVASALRATEGLRFVGEVDDIEPWLKSAAVFVAPVFIGGGVIVKVLDALEAGVPTVTTTRGNEGIGAGPGSDLIVADGAEASAEAIVDLLGKPDARAAIGAAGQRFARRRFSEREFLAVLEAAHERARIAARESS
jgi:glycosyltransferase involved in cell wall biosynthesis